MDRATATARPRPPGTGRDQRAIRSRHTFTRGHQVPEAINQRQERPRATASPRPPESTRGHSQRTR
jgi:hypothetical protein